jgi:hypothetical protein
MRVPQRRNPAIQKSLKRTVKMRYHHHGAGITTTTILRMGAKTPRGRHPGP